MKAILIVDMPKNYCLDCPLRDEDDCYATHEKISSISCPLKPMNYKKGALGSVINPNGYTLSTADELLAEIMGEDYERVR